MSWFSGTSDPGWRKTTTRPDIKPSRLLDPPPEEEREPGKKKKRPGSKGRSKTKSLRIDVEEIIHPEQLPPDAKFEGYRDFVVQDIVMESQNTRYRRAVYRLADGSLIVGQRPDGVDSHFGPALVEFILLQTHHNHVTQGRLLEQLKELTEFIDYYNTSRLHSSLGYLSASRFDATVPC